MRESRTYGSGRGACDERTSLPLQETVCWHEPGSGTNSEVSPRLAYVGYRDNRSLPWNIQLFQRLRLICHDAWRNL